MKRTDFQFFVTRQITNETDRGITYTLELKTGSGHKLTFKGDSKDLFEGYPVGTAVGVKLYNSQTTFAKAKADVQQHTDILEDRIEQAGETMKEEDEPEEEEEEEETSEEE